jgi:hypothetical protein
MAVDSQGVVYKAGTSISALDFTARAGLIACILDAADFHILTSLTPGELVSIFGNDLATFEFAPPANTASGFVRSRICLCRDGPCLDI